jgi:hypothetical protein
VNRMVLVSFHLNPMRICLCGSEVPVLNTGAKWRLVVSFKLRPQYPWCWLYARLGQTACLDEVSLVVI